MSELDLVRDLFPERAVDLPPANASARPSPRARRRRPRRFPAAGSCPRRRGSRRRGGRGGRPLSSAARARRFRRPRPGCSTGPPVGAPPTLRRDAGARSVPLYEVRQRLPELRRAERGRTGGPGSTPCSCRTRERSGSARTRPAGCTRREESPSGSANVIARPGSPTDARISGAALRTTRLEPGGSTGQMTSLDLPSDPDALYARLKSEAEGNANGTYPEMFTLVGDALRENYTTPAQRAALYEVAARLPGIELVGRTVDSAGRAAVGVGMENAHDHVRSILLFDPTSSSLLGEEQTMLSGNRSAIPTAPSWDGRRTSSSGSSTRCRRRW